MASHRVSLRLEGGIGDHILGMRLLYFIRQRYQHYEIVVYSDAAGSRDQLEVVAMSPLVADVIPIYQDQEKVAWETMGRIDNVRSDSLAMMQSADVFIDGFGAHMCIPQSRALGFPVCEILASKPDLLVPPVAELNADRMLARLGPMKVICLNLTKYGSDLLGSCKDAINRIVEQLLRDPDVVILNIFTSGYSFAHWPEPQRSMRQRMAETDSAFLRHLYADERLVIQCIDLPIMTVAALIRRCKYFVGVDNGIKHLAWAFGIPLTFLADAPLHPMFVFRWIPDVHRMLPFTCTAFELAAHIEFAREQLRQER